MIKRTLRFLPNFLKNIHVSASNTFRLALSISCYSVRPWLLALCLGRKIFFIIGLCLLLPSTFAAKIPLSGQAVAKYAPLEKQIIYFMSHYQMPGASMAIMYRGKIVYQRGFGYADVQNRTVVQPNSIFRIASISKLVTSTAVINLIQHHQAGLDYNTKIFAYLNDLHALPTMRENPLIQRIKVIDVLRMLSGWDGHRYIGFDPVFGPWPEHYLQKLSVTTPISCKVAVQFMMGVPLQSVPGTSFSYANINFCLLGLLVSKAINQPYGYQSYENYVKTNILAPMGIHDMQIGSTELVLPNEVHYYSDKKDDELPYGRPDILRKIYSVGGWTATASDLVKLAYGFEHLLTPQSLSYLKQMPPGLRYKVLYPTHYAMGWFVSRKINGYVLYTHGSFTGTRSVMVMRPDGYIISIIFNKRPSPVNTALHKLVYLFEQQRF